MAPSCIVDVYTDLEAGQIFPKGYNLTIYLLRNYRPKCGGGNETWKYCKKLLTQSRQIDSREIFTECS